MQTNILEYFEKANRRRSPEQIAIVDRAHSYTFGELERLSKRCAGLLLRRIESLREPIGVYLPKSANVIFADLGILYTGNIYFNLDTKAPVQRTAAILENICPKLIITCHELADELAAIGVSQDSLLFVEGIFDDTIACETAALWSRLEQLIDADPVCIINTSGSTGVPKGVVLSHRGTIDFLDWCFATFQFTGSERIGSLSPFHFDIYTLELHLCLAKGATIVIIPEQFARFPAKLMEFLVEQRITFVFWVPSIMVTISNQGLLKEFDLTALETIFFAGEVFPTKHLNRWRAKLSATRFVNLYGPIEITVDCTYFTVDRAFSDDDPLPIGFPCRNTDILILNEQDRSCSVDERGELCVRGSSLALGYWNDPERTAEAFVQNPLNPNYRDPIYRTGDIVYRNGRGEIMFVGRVDFQIKHLGYRIDLSEVEFQVLALDEIANACVVYNEQEKAITLFYETTAGVISAGIIRQKLSRTLPKYMLPTAFHEMKELPRNANGKIDRKGVSLLIKQIAVLA